MENEVDKKFQGPKLFKRKSYVDTRGSLSELFRADWLQEAGITTSLIQDNYSHSAPNVVRGLHYQLKNPQAKLVTVIRGAILDIGVDLRRASASFGQWFAVELTEENREMIYLPEGFAHGFSVLGGPADVLYKCSNVYVADDQFGIRYDDPDLRIDWHVEKPLVSERDAQLPFYRDLAEADLF